MPSDAIAEVLARIRPVERGALAAAWERLDSLTKPRRSLGYLEEIAARYIALRGGGHPRVGRKRICVFAGDHGVIAEGVSAYPASVTTLMVRNFLAGGAAINVLARRAGAEVEVIDAGMAEDVGDLPGLLRGNVRRGAGNIAREPAMTVGEAEQAIALGLARAAAAAAAGVTLLATGEMGIGNTTPAAALFAVWLGLPAREAVGPGTGLDAAGIARKAAVVDRAIEVHRARCTGPVETLAALGGLEIAAICGLCLGAAAHGIPAVIDGFISGAGALAALRLCPAVKDHLFFAHRSAEPGHARFFEGEGLRPLVSLDLRLGEGTGAAIAMQIVEDAVAVYNEMATFAEAGIIPGA